MNIYGLHAVKALLKNPKTEVVGIFVQAGRKDQRLSELSNLIHSRGVPVTKLSVQELDALAGGGRHQGIVATITDDTAAGANVKDFKGFIENIADQAFLLILDGVQDPHNLGACLRTANAAGVHAVIAPKDSAVGLTSVVRKVASGAAESTPFFQVANLVQTIEFLKQQNIWIYGTSEEGDKSIHNVDLRPPLAIVMGAEGKGLRRLTKESCDFLISIPMLGDVPSLNVSVATGICLFEVVRRFHL